MLPWKHLGTTEGDATLANTTCIRRRSDETHQTRKQDMWWP